VNFTTKKTLDYGLCFTVVTNKKRRITMCQFAGLINDVVNEFVNDSKMFTAHNVTAEVRRRTTDRVQHDEVKREVHGLFNSGTMFSYNRSLACLPGVNPQPWVYHPISADVSLYNGQPTGSCLAPMPTPTAVNLAAATNSISTNGSSNSDSSKLDTTNRLCIPAKLVRQAGFRSGHNVLVLKNPNDTELVLTNAAYAATMIGVPVTEYIVDSYDNVRITLAALKKGGLDGREFDIEGDSDKITVKPH
jgi:hypothetical protein